MIVFRLFLLLDTVLMALPHTWRKGLIIALSSLAHRFAPKRNRIIQENLAFAFNDQLSLDEKADIERYCYRNLALNFLQVMENRRNSTEDLAQKVTFENHDKVDAILAEGRGIIFISAHFGNWEIGASALSALITPVTSIYKKLDRSEFNPYLLEARVRHGMEMVEKEGALKHLTRALKRQKSVSLMIDQASNARYGAAVNFFGHTTYHASTSAILSHKYNAPIVPLYIMTHDEEHFTIRFEEPIEVTAGDETAIIEATQRQVETLERIIRANPKFWFWCHKRWKGEFPELYRS